MYLPDLPECTHAWDGFHCCSWDDSVYSQAGLMCTCVCMKAYNMHTYLVTQFSVLVVPRTSFKVNDRHTAWQTVGKLLAVGTAYCFMSLKPGFAVLMAVFSATQV